MKRIRSVRVKGSDIIGCRKKTKLEVFQVMFDERKEKYYFIDHTYYEIRMLSRI